MPIIGNADANVSRHLLALSAALLGLAESRRYPHYSPEIVFQREVMDTMESVGDWLQLVVDHPLLDCLPLLFVDWLQNWSLSVHQLLKDHLKENPRPKGSNFLAATWRRMMSQFVLGCQCMRAVVLHYAPDSAPVMPGWTGTWTCLHELSVFPCCF